MKPYYRDDSITIYCGKTEAILPIIGPVDLVLSDPPYGIGEAAGKNKSRAGPAHFQGKARKRVLATDYGNSSWDNAPISDQLMAAVIGAGAYACIFGGNYYSLPPSSAWLVWDKENSGDFADVELAWTNYGTAARLFRHQWNGMLRKYREKRFHPTQKPLDLMKWCIKKCPKMPETILDPFMGSGTTLRAAKDFGIAAIGVEQSEEYCSLAVKRLKQSVFCLES